ncbi:MAG: hypothetical protein ACT4PE_01085 [Candidatus Eiseniibacteriota bacterium]
MRRLIRPVRFLPILCAALLAGCLSGDDDPAAGDEAALTAAENDTAEGIADTAFQMLGSMLETVSDPDGSSPLRETTASYDPNLGQWTVQGTEPYDEPEASGLATFTALVSFHAAGQAQQYPDDLTDQADVQLSGTNVGNYHPADRDFDIDYDWEADAGLQAVRTGSIVDITGGGALTGTTAIHLGNLTVPRTHSATWSYSLSLDISDPAGCATGTVTGTMNQHTFDGTLSGGVMNWTLRRNGNVVVTGTEDYICGAGSPTS